MSTILQHFDAIGIALGVLLACGVLALLAGMRRALPARARADRKAAREKRLRETWRLRALALGLQPRDDESTDDLIDRVMETRVRGSVSVELQTAARAAHARQEP